MNQKCSNFDISICLMDLGFFFLLLCFLYDSKCNVKTTISFFEKKKTGETSTRQIWPRLILPEQLSSGQLEPVNDDPRNVCQNQVIVFSAYWLPTFEI